MRASNNAKNQLNMHLTAVLRGGLLKRDFALKEECFAPRLQVNGFWADSGRSFYASCQGSWRGLSPYTRRSVGCRPSKQPRGAPTALLHFSESHMSPPECKRILRLRVKDARTKSRNACHRSLDWLTYRSLRRACVVLETVLHFTFSVH